MTFVVNNRLRQVDARGRKYMNRMQLLKAPDGLTDAFTGYVTDEVDIEAFNTGVFVLQIDFADATSVEALLETSEDGGFTWAPWESEGAPSSGVFTRKPRIDKWLAADELTGNGTEELLGTLTDANMNVTTDQEIELTDLATLIAADPQWAMYQISRITATGASTSLTAADGGVYPTTSKGGTAIVAAAQIYTALVVPADTLDLTLNDPANTFSVGSIYLSLTGAQGGAATADFSVYGIPAPTHELAFQFGDAMKARLRVKHTGGTDDLPQVQVFFLGGR